MLTNEEIVAIFTYCQTLALMIKDGEPHLTLKFTENLVKIEVSNDYDTPAECLSALKTSVGIKYRINEVGATDMGCIEFVLEKFTAHLQFNKVI